MNLHQLTSNSSINAALFNSAEADSTLTKLGFSPSFSLSSLQARNVSTEVSPTSVPNLNPKAPQLGQ